LDQMQWSESKTFNDEHTHPSKNWLYAWKFSDKCRTRAKAASSQAPSFDLEGNFPYQAPW
jgi:hypothetical protein